MVVNKSAAYIFLVLILTLPTLVGGIVYFSADNMHPVQLGFPFKLEETQDASSMWRATIILSPEYYSKANLDRLFLWYNKRHPEKKDELTVTVYTDPERLRRRIQNWRQVVAPRPNQPGNHPADHYDAICWRKGDGLLAGGGDNLWYVYSPDLKNPAQTKYVVLRGRDYFADKKIIESWETSNSNFKITIIAYELLMNVEPVGTYYTFSRVIPYKDDLSEEAILTIRQDEAVPIPREQIKFISDQVGYVFMGWLYSVTADGGKTWRQWDAETELTGWQCCDPKLIQNVNISSDGNGTMTLRPELRQPEKTLILRTQDYGQHWSTN
jgi:hypothetical protein